MKRYLYNHIHADLKKKMVFLTGPRQVGKTYLAKEIQKEFKNSTYLNNDDIKDSRIIRKKEWALNSELIVLDEIHKMKGWKNFLKGTFDTRNSRQTFLVTGSARLETFRQTGDSLAGRYFSYRLHPISVRELSGKVAPYEAVSMLNRLGGFPEPFLSGSDEEAARWRKHYFSDIVREDIMDYSRINEIRAIRLLLEMLRQRVGSPVSFSSMAEDLQVSPNTIRKYLNILESLNIIFIIRPFHKNIARSLLKEPKVYFYDSGYVEGDEGIKLENTVAACLLKNVHYLQDAKGSDLDLYYVKTKDKKEIDFALADKNALTDFIEVKLSDSGVSPHLRYFKERYPKTKAVQLVHNARYDTEVNGVQILRAGEWLAKLEV
jgi:predicted AAA+ superfamily ATPase